MTDAVKVDFALQGAGWADCRLEIGLSVLEMKGVSYCTDALGDLVRVAALIAAGHHAGTLSFDGEPREWRWILERHWSDDLKGVEPGLRIRIFGFPDIYRHAPESEGHLEFEAVCGPDSFALAVERMAESLWDALGADGYAEVWGAAPFPERALAGLKAVLGSPEKTTA